MRTFTLPSFVAFIGTLRLEMDHANHAALDRAGRIVRDEAKRVLGTYEYGWPQLAPSTLEKKAANTPGIETREMHDSIEYTADHKSVEIGTNNDKAIWFELGTSRQPPRSFLVGALQHKKDDVVKAIGMKIVGHLSGESVVGPNSLRP